LPAWAPIPGLGTIAINTFVLRGREPMLVDTGPAVLGDHFMQGLRSLVDPADLRWIWLSHTDPDHIGNLARVLAETPHAKVLTTFLGAAKMEMLGCDMSRVQLLEPGKVFEAAGHRLHPLRPPYYDAPESLGFFDETTRVMYAVDSFGAVLPEPAHDLSEVRMATLSEGMATWSSIDAPWLARSNGTLLARTLAGIGAGAAGGAPGGAVRGHGDLVVDRRAVAGAQQRHAAGTNPRGNRQARPFGAAVGAPAAGPRSRTDAVPTAGGDLRPGQSGP